MQAGWSYAETSEKLMAVIPALKDEYAALLDDWAPDTPGVHIVFGDLLNPYLVRSDPRAPEADIDRVFAFLEEMLSHEDPEVANVVTDTVLHGIVRVEHLGRLGELARHMRPRTLTCARESAALMIPEAEAQCLEALAGNLQGRD